MKHLLICACLLAAACNNRPPAEAEAKSEPVEHRRPGEIILTAEAQRNAGIVAEPVRLENVAETITATGELTVNEERTWNVGALIEGRIIEVLATPGDFVKAGMVLARMHSHDVHDSRADYRRASEEVARARAAVATAQRLRDRAARLLELKAASRQDVELAEAQLREALAVQRNAETEQARIRTHITEYLEVPLVGSGDSHDSDIPIKAPASGLVIDRKATAGTVVSPGQEVFRISDTSSVWMIARVNETDLSALRAGQNVRVLVRAWPDRPFQGRIVRLGEQLDPTTRTLQVRVLVPNPNGLLKPEMYAAAEIEGPGKRQRILVPTAAVQDLNGARAVFVKTSDSHFEVRPVETARVIAGSTEIASGLEPGEQVVVKGSFVLKSELLRGSLEEE